MKKIVIALSMVLLAITIVFFGVWGIGILRFHETKVSPGLVYIQRVDYPFATTSYSQTFPSGFGRVSRFRAFHSGSLTVLFENETVQAVLKDDYSLFTNPDRTVNEYTTKGGITFQRKAPLNEFVKDFEEGKKFLQETRSRFAYLIPVQGQK